MPAKGVNKVIILGNLGRDPETRYMQSGDAVTNLAIATSESWKDQSGQPQERTEWHRVVAFKKLAEIMNQYLKKGSKVYIEGKLQTKKWQDQSGSDRYTTEIIASEMQMLGDKAQGQEQQARKQPNFQQPQNQPTGMSDFDDDIPFNLFMKGHEYII